MFGLTDKSSKVRLKFTPDKQMACIQSWHTQKGMREVAKAVMSLWEVRRRSSAKQNNRLCGKVICQCFGIHRRQEQTMGPHVGNNGSEENFKPDLLNDSESSYFDVKSLERS